uniref:Bulb-type lectin domain-containing protein n=1 Tax=Ditylum brightwellii TaxID=49249 RepID=A0A7S4VH95_9STRA
MRRITSIAVFAAALMLSGIDATNAKNLRSLNTEEVEFERGYGYRIIMNSDDTLLSGEVRSKFQRKCVLELTDEGELITYRRRNNGKLAKKWQSGSRGSDKGHYKTSLQKDGNLVTKNIDTGEVVWSTRSQDPDGQDWVCGKPTYYLLFGNGGVSSKSGECNLSIWKQRPGCPIDENSYYSTVRSWWWSNAHDIMGRNIYRQYAPMNFVLQKGEVSYGFWGPDGEYTMMLDQTCNLVVFEGNTIKDKNNIVWSSEDDGAENVDPSGDCHLFAKTKNPYDSSGQGELVLYKGPYKRGIQNSYEDRGRRYWSRNVTCAREEDGTYHVTFTTDGPHGFDFSCYNGVDGYDW